nr:MAG TPA: putative tail fiber protein [Caudoviricetes sp.]
MFLYQIAVPENMIGMYVRRCWNGNWSEWKSITLT